MSTVNNPNQTSGTNAQDPSTDYWGDGPSSDYNFDTGNTTTPGNKNTTTPHSTPIPPTTTRNMGTGGQGTAGGADPGDPTGNPYVQEQIQNLLAQGKTPLQIQQILAQQGINVSMADILYAQEGWNGAHDRGYGYGPDNLGKGLGTGGNGLGALSRAYGSPYFNQYMQTQQMAQDAQQTQSSAKRQGQEQMMKLHMILLQILMGDLTGALRSYSVLMDRDMRNFARMVVQKLGKVREARSRVIRNFGSQRPPRAYAGEDPGAAARAQDRSQRYTQFVQLSTQLMNELQNTERELVDALQTIFRDVENFWQGYASMRDEKFRTDNRIMRIQ
jgi:hypothetical protein